METRATAAAVAQAAFQRAMGVLWRRWVSLGRRHRLPIRVGLLAVVVLTGVLTPLVPVVLSAAPRAQAAPAAMPPRGPAPYGALPLQPNQPAPALPATSWQGRGPKAPPATKSATPATKSATAPATGRSPGEQVDLRTATSKTYLNADGTWTLRAADGPIHYQDAQGTWQDIDTTVVGDASDAGYPYGVTANSWKVHFARESGGPKLLHLQGGALNFSETLEGAATVPAALTGPRVIYLGVFPGVDLQYGVGTRTLEEELILHDAHGPASYRFSYHVPGASARQDAAGTIIFTDSAGHELLRIGGVAMYEADAAGRMTPTGAGTGQVTVTLAGAAPDYTVTLTPDRAWLADPARVFPVGIDPEFKGVECTTGCGTSANIYSDTFDESGNPTWNFYTDNAERIGNCNAIPSTAPGYGTGVDRSFIKFNIGGLPDPNTRITGASLQLYQTTAYSTATVGVKEIQSAWDARTETWNTEPAANGAGWVAGKAANSTYNTWLTIDVSAVIYDWWFRGYAQNGFELAYQDETQPCDFFAADDYGDSTKLPALTITYATDVTAPTVGTLTLNGVNPGGTTPPITNNPVVTLGTMASDPGSTFWQSNWSSTSGVGAATGGRAAAFSVDASHTMLIANTSTCGTTLCTPETFFTSTVVPNMANWPTFTAMFKTDHAPAFWFGVVSRDNANTRFNVVSNDAGTAFSTLQFAWSAGVISTTSVNIPFSANTWYYGQVVFPQPNAGEIYVWPAGQPRPAAPAARVDDIVMSNPGLNFWNYGDNGANLHHLYVGQATMTQRDGSGTAGFGLQEVGYSNDGGTTYGCPTQSGWTYCVAATGQTSWTLSSGDGTKTVTVKYVDNAGKVTTQASTSVILDTTAPTVSITSPVSGREVRGWMVVTGSASDPTALDGSNSGIFSIGVYLDGLAVCQNIPNTSTPTFKCDTTNWAPGKHTLTLHATDFAGNTNISPAVMVDVSNGGQMAYETVAKRTLPDGKTSVGVNTANGDAVVEHTDVDIPSRGPNLSLTRTYNALAPANGLFGYGWTSDLDESVAANADGSVTYRDASGGYHLFQLNGSAFVTPPGLFASLVKNVDGTFTLTGHDQSVTTFNGSGYLTSFADRNGNALTVSYSGLTPTMVTDAPGRTLTLTVSGGHVTKLVGPAGSGLSYGYAYDASGNLTDFTDQVDSTTPVVTHYAYDASHRLTTITLNYKAGAAADVQTNVATQLSYVTASGDANLNRLTQILDPMGYDVGINYDNFTPGLNSGGQLVAGPVSVGQLQVAPCPLPTTGSSTNCTTPTVSLTDGPLYEVSTYTATTDGQGTAAEIDAPGPNGTPATTISSYDSGGSGLVTRVVDANATVTTYSYDASGNLAQQVVDPHVTTGDAHLALTTTYAYDSANNLTDKTSQQDTQTTVASHFVYDTPAATGRLLQEYQNYKNGGVNGPNDDASSTNVLTQYSYDQYGEVVTQTDPMGVVTLYQYDPNGDVVEAVKDCINQSGCPTVAPDIAAADKTANTTTSASYDALGEQTFATDAQNVVTAATYDIHGNLVRSIANCVNQTGCPTSPDTDPNTVNVTTSATFDALGRTLTETTQKDKDPTTQQPIYVTNATFYDANGRVTRSVQNCVNGCPVGATSDAQTNVTTTTAYDAAGNVTLTTDPAGNQSVTRYNALNRVTEAIQQSGDTTPVVISDTQTSYDALGQVTKTVVDPGDPNANPAHKNLTTTYAYDAAGRKLTMTQPPADPSVTDPTNPAGQASVTHYVYDAAGEVTRTYVTNQAVASGNVSDTSVTYDALGRPVTKTEQAGTKADGTAQALATTFVYDKDGRTAKQTDPTGTTRVDRDALGQPVTVWHPDGSSDGASYDKAGRTTTTSNSSGTTKYYYDNLWRVVKEEHYDANNVLVSTTSHAYDAQGHELAPITTLADGTQTGLSYSYDALGRIASVSDGARTYAYDPNGRMGSMSVYSDAAKTNLAYRATYGYDAGTRTTTLTDLVGPTATQLHSYSYGYDTANNILTATADGATTGYVYDDLNELTQVTDATGTTSFSYDANHNRTQLVALVGASTFTTHYTYDTAADTELLAKTDPNGKVTQYSYDAAGNLAGAVYDPTTLDPGGVNRITTYGYDPSGRLNKVTEPDGTTIAFSFDADGNRAKKTVTTGGATPTITQVKDVYQAGRIAYQTDGAGVTLATFTYDGYGVPASVQVGADPATASRYYYVYNGHGDVVALTDTSGSTVATYSYDAFGGVSATEFFANGWSNPYRYDGKDRVRYDSETSLYWMSVRAYDPTLGRFISRDPLNRQPFAWANQPYIYGANNPLVNTDPSGQFIVSADGDLTTATSTPRRPTPSNSGGHITTSAPQAPQCSTPRCQALQEAYADHTQTARETIHTRANDAQRFFNIEGIVLALTGTLVGGAGFLFTEMPVVAAALWGIAVGFATTAAYAFVVAADFGWEAGWNESTISPERIRELDGDIGHDMLLVGSVASGVSIGGVIAAIIARVIQGIQDTVQNQFSNKVGAFIVNAYLSILSGTFLVGIQKQEEVDAQEGIVDEAFTPSWHG